MMLRSRLTAIAERCSDGDVPAADNSLQHPLPSKVITVGGMKFIGRTEHLENHCPNIMTYHLHDM